MAISIVRRTCAVAATLFLTVLAVVGTAGTAQAADGYRYWNYSHLDQGRWEMSEVGADGYQPEDGAVEGYRYGTSTVARGIFPRADLAEVTFAAVCGAGEAPAGDKRVAVVLDFGTAADAEGATPPTARAECAVVDRAADGQQVLQAVADVRSGAVPTCAIDGYPAAVCGEPVKDAQVSSTEQPVVFDLPGAAAEDGVAGADDTSNPGAQQSGNDLTWPLAGVGLVVVLLAGGAVMFNRRTKTEA